METPLVSVIIPVMNAQSYILPLIQMLEAQTYPSIEVILCENGSTDDTSLAMTQALEQYPSNQHCIKKFLHVKRAGVSAARNLGIANATGKYCVFFDGDDILAPELIMYLVFQIQGVQMASCGYDVAEDCEPSKVLYQSPESTARVLHATDMMCRIFFVEHYQGFIWNKIFRRDLIEKYQIRFHEDVYYNEDRTFIIEYLTHTHCTRMAPSHLYHYQLHPKSAMGKVREMQQSEDTEFFERRVTEVLGFSYMRRALRRFRDAYYCCGADMIYSELRLFSEMLTAHKEQGRNFEKSLLRKFARRAMLLPFEPENEKRRALYHKLIMYGYTGSTYTPNPEWFFRIEET